MIIALAVIPEMGVIRGIVSGKGLADLIREKVGTKFTFLMMVASFSLTSETCLQSFQA